MGRARAAGISPGGQSAGTRGTVRKEPDSPSVLCVLHEFLRVFRSIHSVGGFLLHGVHERSVLKCRTVRDGADGLRAHRGWYVIEGAVLVVRDRFSDSPPQPADGPSYRRGRSAWCTALFGVCS
jgi:hypothetical protein